MKLTDAQLKHYETFGYLVLRDWLPAPALDALRAEADHALRRSYGGVAADPDLEQATLTMGDDTPMLSQGLELPMFLEPAKQLFGTDVLGVATYVTSHTGETGWHADSPNEFPRGVKFSIYLDALDETNGALRVLPGSHRGGWHVSVRDWMQDTSRETEDPDVPFVPCPTRPGDVIVFDLRLFHAALGGGEDRRVVNLFYYEDPSEPDDERLVREQIIEDFEWLSDKNRTDARVFHPNWLANTGANPERARWIERFDALGFFEGDPDRSGRFAATALPEETCAALEAGMPEGWSLHRTSVKSDLVRVVVMAPRGEVTVLIRPASNPRPRYMAADGLAYGYSTLDCSELRDGDLRAFEQVIDHAHASAASVFRGAMGVEAG